MVLFSSIHLKTNKPELNQLHPKSVIQLRDVFQANEKSKDVCYACQKAVYVYDRLFAFNRTYHLKCFKCYKCDRKLNVWKFKTENGRVCCEPLCPVKPKTNSNGHSSSTQSVDSQE
ncbi:hypothetical protein PHET_04123 [Paragonimus heterotremus]|uniref:LIM zinc-binding domain-containing protein n=1 Tax=Paragonimus heterotremus TaxID=100268 RepID=A0A8J4WJB3_9TREM|nr:hypothetical protein PHET_04123 [Paragonimus heterotremus]